MFSAIKLLIITTSTRITVFHHVIIVKYEITKLISYIRNLEIFGYVELCV